MTEADGVEEGGAATTGTTHPSPGHRRRRRLEAILSNLSDVETSLHDVLRRNRDGQHGYVTREWGFTAPGGLGGRLGGKFRPWEDRLASCRTFFWPVEAYSAMEAGPDYGMPDPALVKRLKLRPEGEQLYGNTPLHQYLAEPPSPPVRLEGTDYESYRDAARIFLLLGTLAHLYGNSAVDRSAVELPAWIEDPLLVVARRLDVEPTLSGHFLVQENWVWRTTLEREKEDVVGNYKSGKETGQVTTQSSDTGKPEEGADARDPPPSKDGSHIPDQTIVTAPLRECLCEDRRYRIRVYPNCFVGSQLVDVLMDGGYAPTREDAVRLGRKINRTHRLFSHVTNDHLLMDKHLFCEYPRERSY
jgi:hypothetical protein